MKRSRRSLLNFAAWVSVLLCVATAVFWMRSYWWRDMWDWSTTTGRAGIDSFRGRVGIGELRITPATSLSIPRGMRVGSEPAESAGYMKSTWFWYAGLQGVDVAPRGSWSVRDLRIPHWWFILATLVIPWCALRSHRLQAGRKRKGLCLNCGYDLRATPGRCPECGAVPGRKEIVST
jgi:hypothetical protein